jgi:hypothetical protein
MITTYFNWSGAAATGKVASSAASTATVSRRYLTMGRKRVNLMPSQGGYQSRDFCPS